MSSTVRSVLVLVGCLTALAVAGVLATTALRSATVAPTQLATAPVVVDANESSGAARLTVLAPVWFDSGGGRRQVAAGTEFTTASALLADALHTHGAVGVGDTLRCAMRISISQGEPVIDLVRCERAKTSPRG
ncbi:MAG TPA: hypothetical protein VJX10_14035 [Pseudonocardiaceae bacterium]|nr:hypothetical protein [Pseudonocardiaceae bacterium]